MEGWPAAMPAVQQQLRMGPELAVAVAMLKLVKKAGTHVLRMRWCGVTRAHWGLRLSSLLIPAAPTLPPSSPPHLRHALMATCFACMRPLAPRPASHVPFACMPRPAGHVPVACMPRPRTSLPPLVRATVAAATPLNSGHVCALSRAGAAPTAALASSPAFLALAAVLAAGNLFPCFFPA